MVYEQQGGWCWGSQTAFNMRGNRALPALEAPFSSACCGHQAVSCLLLFVIAGSKQVACLPIPASCVAPHADALGGLVLQAAQLPGAAAAMALEQLLPLVLPSPAGSVLQGGGVYYELLDVQHVLSAAQQQQRQCASRLPSLPWPRHSARASCVCCSAPGWQRAAARTA